MRRVFTGDTPAQAQLVAGFLKERGITSVVEGEMLTGARYELPTDESTLPGVFVNDEDAARARAAIAEAEASKPAASMDDELPERKSLRWFKLFVLYVLLFPIGLIVLLYGWLTRPPRSNLNSTR
jgi:hypothetical protein